MPDLLLEVLSEEIPARMQAGGAEALANSILSRLQDAQLAESSKEAEYFYTPRRLVVRVRNLQRREPDITLERKGPRVDAPQKAIDGFCKSAGVTREKCEERETPKGLFLFAIIQKKGRFTSDQLADMLPEALAAVSWPKSMRWEESGTRWVRPIRSILCLLGGDVVPFRFGPVESGRTTLGHRFLSSGPLTIEHAGQYAATLELAKVMLDPEQRIQKIEADAQALAESAGFSLAVDTWLKEENAGLAEWPVVRMGTIDETFMDLPAPILRSAMRTHQRYFGCSLLETGSPPAPRFIMVSNAETADGGEAIVAGNERVLRARLADARFFWDQDRKQKLVDRVPQLEGVVFHARLGSMYQKAKRIEALARFLFIAIGDAYPDWAEDADPDDAARAGLLCKADLVTETVGEFPDLQGVIGARLAATDGEPTAVWMAVVEHYRPQGPDVYCPENPVSIAVALADKLDTLVGFFAIDERPTGSKDPFALRRAALGVIRIIIEQDTPLRLSLDYALMAALAGYGDTLPEEPGTEATHNGLRAFIADRVKVNLREQGVRHDLVEAVFATGNEDDLVRMRARVRALRNFLESEDGANLLTAYRRAANILRIEEKKDGRSYYGRADATLFAETEERVLHTRITDALFRADAALGREDFAEAMAAMATLREPVDAFFDHVTVNCEDAALRRNRLLMLSQIRDTLDRVADFSKIEG